MFLWRVEVKSVGAFSCTSLWLHADFLLRSQIHRIDSTSNQHWQSKHVYLCVECVCDTHTLTNDVYLCGWNEAAHFQLSSLQRCFLITVSVCQRDRECDYSTPLFLTASLNTRRLCVCECYCVCVQWKRDLSHLCVCYCVCDDHWAGKRAIIAS